MSVDLDLDELRKMKLENIVDLLEGKKDDEEEDKEEGSESDDSDEEEVEESVSAQDVVGDAVKTLFEGQEVTEDFVKKAKDIVSVLVAEKAKSLMESELVKIEAKIQSRLDEKQAESDKQIDAYLNYVVEEWLKENEVAITSNVKAERYDSIIGQLAETFASFNVSVETLDPLKESEDKVVALEAEVQKLALALQESQEELKKTEFVKAIDEVTADLAESEKEKFAAVIGELDVELDESIEDFKGRLTSIKNIFVKKAGAAEEVNESSTEGEEVITEKTITESETPEEKPSVVNEKMALYQKSIRRSFSALSK